MPNHYLNNKMAALISERIDRAERDRGERLDDETLQKITAIQNEIVSHAAEIEDLLGF